ncbi:DUF4350 domain-containing protein [Sphingomonas humi]|uniref:ABC-type uncharacterized transport system domain-containing protein n=1 Tax=Sphingomonas humi TaxID=335630 RepID=A0ABP7RDU0_9SPHN
MRSGLLLLLGAMLCACKADGAAQGGGPKPELALLTSLPIVFGERFGLDQQAQPLLAELEADYKVTAVDGPEQLRPGGLLLAVQPQALTAERLVALDKWVRDGGRIVLLADPLLRFDSGRPLGDKFRPPLRYPDTGLLAHWGVTLDEGADSRAEGSATDLGRGIRLASADIGSFTRAGGTCTLAPTRAVARCRIGNGYATLVADADLAMSEDPADRKAVLALLGELRR